MQCKQTFYHRKQGALESSAQLKILLLLLTLTVFVVYFTHTAKSLGDLIQWYVCGKNWSRPNLETTAVICLQQVRKTVKSLSHVCWFLGQNS
jgi:flagellar biosynthesis protein FlhB